jgi:hypothetical protein
MDESQWEGGFKSLAGADGRISEREWRAAMAKGDGLPRGSENWAEAIGHFDRNFDGKLDFPEIRVYLQSRRDWILTRFDSNGDGSLSDSERRAANEYLQEDLLALAASRWSHPVKAAQPLAMIGALLLAAALAAFFRLRRREGQVFGLMAIAYSLIRFFEEGIRDTNAHNLLQGQLTHNQYTAIAIAGAGVLMMWCLRFLPASAGPTWKGRLATTDAPASGRNKS